MDLITLVLIPAALTALMFYAKQAMLGFPCVIFWAILGAHAYQLSTATWDYYYLLFFGAMGMVIFCSLAMWGLRTRKQEKQEGNEFIDKS